MNRAPLCLAALLLLIAVSARAGALSPDLERKLSKLAPGEPLPVLVRLRERAPVERILAAQKARGADLRERHREIIVALREAAGSQHDLLTQLVGAKALGVVTAYRSFWITNLVSVTATREMILQIAARPDVEIVAPSFHAQLIEPVERGPGRDQQERRSRGAPYRGHGGRARGEGGIPDGIRAIRAPEVWRDFGINGEGVVVANLDTGVDADHPALRNRWRGREPGIDPRACWFVPANPSSDYPNDSNGHGTHVMGTITGLGVATGDTVGVAWGAKWIAGDIFGSGKGGSPPDSSGQPEGDEVIQAFQWFADPDGNADTSDDVPAVVQNSWGTSAEEGGIPCDPTWWEAIDNCEAAGVVVTWSAGNSGPTQSTIIVPADRASTPTRNFSIGAVNATDSHWPYSVAMFSSRGPSICTPDGQMAIKPEVVAPGVNVYSSVPGGGYAGGWSGTSMAGPHVAGVVALIRQANPDIDPDTVKEILMETARRPESLGAEDNANGWGFVDAYAAVSRAMTDFGSIEGTVWNGSVEGLVVPDADVGVLGSAAHFHGRPDGRFRGAVPAVELHAIASRSGFAPETLAVQVEVRETTHLEFHLRDIEAPLIRPVDLGIGTVDTLGPYPVQAKVTDPSGIGGVTLHHRKGTEPWQELAMTGSPDGNWRAVIPGAPADTRIDYSYVATDRAGLTSRWPSGVPDSSAIFLVRHEVYETSFENSPEPGWQAGVEGDDATAGGWVQADPVGTFDQESGRVVQPENDHTPGAGSSCFITGNGTPGGLPGAADVDGGCTTLLSPVLRLHGEKEAFVSYARWFNMSGASADDTLYVDVSADGGSSWVALERVSTPDTLWQVVDVRLQDLIALTDRVRLRFVACDRFAGGVTEAGIDDLSITAFTPRTSVPGDTVPSATLLLAPAPNPARGPTQVRFQLRASASVELAVFDLLGRRVRVITETDYPAGTYALVWDGRDERGHRVASGLYYLRLRAGGIVDVRPVVMRR
jgi:subtilisin family serine protease